LGQQLLGIALGSYGPLNVRQIETPKDQRLLGGTFKAEIVKLGDRRGIEKRYVVL